MASQSSRRVSSAQNSIRFTRTPVAAACAVMLIGLAGNVQAQQADPTTVDTVVVTGIRRGIEDAISVKKNSDSIVETISAEDIGKLPDSSIAESIARLPGVTAQRVAGRASNISIRGLSGDFSTALLNGREQVSTGDNRAVEFDQYPSELLSSVVIYKTPDAALVGQGLSGTTDMRTIRPLAFGKRAVSVNLRGEKSGLGTDFTGKGTRFNFSYVDQFADKKLGVAFGYARFKSDVTTLRQENYDTSTDFDANGTIPKIKVVNGFKYFNDSTTQTRDGLMGVLEFKPNNQLSTSLDLYYSKFDKDVVKRGLEVQVNDSWKFCCSDNPRLLAQQPALEPGYVVQDGRLVSGTWLNVNPLSRHIAEPRKDDVKSAGWNTKFKFSEDFTGVLDLSTSEAKRKEKITEIEAGAPTPEKVTVVNGNQISAFQYNHGDPAVIKLTDPESWGQNGYDKDISTVDKVNSVRIGWEVPLHTFVNNLAFGVNFADRKKDKTANEFKLVLPAGTSTFAPLPGNTGAVNVGGGLSTVAFNPNDVFPSAYTLKPNYFADIFLKSWNVTEKVRTTYVKGDIDSTLAGKTLHGNVGLQVVNTDQNSTAPQVDLSKQDIATRVTQGKTYNDFLPSLNLALNLNNDQIVRFGAARVLARARMDQMSAGRRYKFDSGKNIWTGEGGNAYLDPFRADAVDLSYEKYFGTKAYVSAATFYKKLKSYVFDFNDKNYSFDGFPLPLNVNPNSPPSTLIGEFKQPRNGQGGNISGIELAASMPFNLLTPKLDGFGAVANFSNTSSEIKPFGDTDTRPLPGLSKRVASLAVYYEKNGFSARVADRYRSDFLGEITGFGAGREYKFIKSETVVDMQLGYEFLTGPVKGLSLLLQVNNLNDAKYREYVDRPDNIVKTDKYGKTALFGATYKF